MRVLEVNLRIVNKDIFHLIFSNVSPFNHILMWCNKIVGRKNVVLLKVQNFKHILKQISKNEII